MVNAGIDNAKCQREEYYAIDGYAVLESRSSDVLRTVGTYIYTYIIYNTYAHHAGIGRYSLIKSLKLVNVRSGKRLRTIVRNAMAKRRNSNFVDEI